MFKRLCLLGISLILGGVVLLAGRLSGMDNEFISVIYYGIMVVALVIYAVDALIEFKNESCDYEDGVREYGNLWENVAR